VLPLLMVPKPLCLQLCIVLLLPLLKLLLPLHLFSFKLRKQRLHHQQLVAPCKTCGIRLIRYNSVQRVS
jgi:hypothetical protein